MIKAIIFDLDNCLAAANEVGEHLFGYSRKEAEASSGSARSSESA